MLEQPTGTNGHPGTSSTEIVTVSSPVNIPTTSSVTECTVNSVNSHTAPPTHVNNPSHLYDTLYPLLLHQHSTLTSLQHILNPIQHLHTIPTHAQRQHQLHYRKVEANIEHPSPPVLIKETNGGAGYWGTKHSRKRPKKSSYWPPDAGPEATHQSHPRACPAATPNASNHTHP